MALPARVEKIEDVAEALREHYAKGQDGMFYLAAEGVEDVSGLKTALKAERDAVAAAKAALKQFEGIDVKAYHEIMDRLENDEEAKLLNAGKKDELRVRWTGKMQEAHAKELEKLQKERKAELEKVEARAKKFESRVLENALRAATIEVEGFHKPATRDWINYAQTIFVLDDDGRAVKKRTDGTVLVSKDGKSPFSPKDELEEQREVAPHWFSASGSGTGAAPSRTTTNGSGQKSMARADFAKLSPAQQHAFVIKEKGVVVDT